MKTWTNAWLAAALAWPCAAAAEDGKLEASLEVRVRLEALDGQFRPALPASNVAVLTRVLAAAEYDAGPIRVGGEFEDSRSFFERSSSSIGTTEVNTLEPLQAYLSTDISEGAKLTAGRFTLNLGSRRLIARNQFRNTINSYTGANLVLGGKAYGATAFWMIPQARLPDEVERIRDNAAELDRERGGPRLFGVWSHAAALGGVVEAYLYRLAEHDSPDILTRDRRLWTAGARLFRAPAAGHWDWDVEGAYQWGRARQSSAATDLLDRDVSAGLFHGEGGYTMPGGWHVRPAVGFDFGSGDGPGARYTRFDTLYSARVFDYGPTSYYGPLTRANIVSPFLRVDIKPSKRLDGQATLRPAWLASATDQFAVTGVRDPAGAAGKWAGVAFDARLRRTLIPDRLRASAGFALLFKGGFLENAANAPDTGDTRYGFLELTATF